MNPRKAEYEAYLCSATWQGKRKVALAAADHRCQTCNVPKNLDVHHRTYERFGGDELPGDLTVLCRSCHELFHGKRFVARPSTKRKKAMARKQLVSCTSCGKNRTSKGTCRPCRRDGKRRRQTPKAVSEPQPLRPLTNRDREALVIQINERLRERRMRTAA